MAEWSAPLPDEAVEGELTHIEDHNKIVAAIEEARQEIDNIEVPDTTALASRVYVDNAIAGIEIPSTEGFATKAELADKADLSDVQGKVAGFNGIAGLWAGTQAEFDALTPDPDVVYVVVEG